MRVVLANTLGLRYASQLRSLDAVQDPTGCLHGELIGDVSLLKPTLQVGPILVFLFRQKFAVDTLHQIPQSRRGRLGLEDSPPQVNFLGDRLGQEQCGRAEVFTTRDLGLLLRCLGDRPRLVFAAGEFAEPESGDSREQKTAGQGQ